MRKVRVYMVDDHDIVLTGLTSTLELAPDIEIVGSSTDGGTALADIRRLLPDVVILDLELPRLPGREILRQIQEDQLPVRVLVYSQHDELSFVAEALRLGAAGYITKSISSLQIVEAVWRVKEGRRYLWPAYSEKEIAEYQRRTGRNSQRSSELSRRERELLILVAIGDTSPAIANYLHIDVRTVENYRYRFMKKLGLHNIAEITRFAIEHDLIRAEIE